MAGDKRKKRQASVSPSCSTTAKRAREHSRDASVQSNSQTLPRELPGPYLPFRHSRNTSPLPNNDDWSFRVKVISSTTNLQDEYFQKAVQGLAKICLPKGVLEELGVDLLAKHMRADQAPEKNIARMIEVFRGEMINRVSWMLAEYLDTPAKVQLGVKMTIAASSELHVGVRDNIFGTVASSLVHEESRSDATNFVAGATVRDSGRAASQETARDVHDRNHENSQEMIVDAEEPIHSTEQRGPPCIVKKTAKKKVSTSWRWDVDPDVVPINGLGDVFKRPSDLFAYHALPIARGLLAPNAHRKDVRLKIQDMLDSMPDDEYKQWEESLDKLKDGNDTMLVRIAPEVMLCDRTTATPAPAGHVYKVSRKDVEMEKTEDVVHNSHHVKPKENMSHEENVRPQQNVPDHFNISTHTILLRVGPNSGLDTPTIRQTHTVEAGRGRTPVLDVLWGCTPLPLDNWAAVVHMITDRLSQRIPVEYIMIPSFDRPAVKVTKDALKSRLTSYVTIVKTGHPGKTKAMLEKALIPWVVVMPSAFPELAQESFIFAHIVPSITTTIDVLCGFQFSMTNEDDFMIKVELFSALKKRGIDHSFKNNSTFHPLHVMVENIILKNARSERQKRGRLERCLRHLAFEHREKFPELKSSRLVKVWEQSTGEKW